MSAQSGSSNANSNVLLTYGCMALWIVLSAAVILINKYVLSYSGFPFPIALTMSHMIFCSSLAYLLVAAGVVESVPMDRNTYLRCVLPISGLFAGTLWFGNAAYMYLSVSFIQMIKAIMPLSVFITGIFLGTEKYSFFYSLNILVVGLGTGIASYGELDFNLVGYCLQLGSIVTESLRLVMIQILLQQRGIKLNPVMTLYYIAPGCLLFLIPIYAIVEFPVMYSSTTWVFQPTWILASATAAFALNMAVFLLIGRSSALTMNLAGVLKDWMLIILSVLLYRSRVTAIQIFGYGIAFFGVAWYNYQKIVGTKSSQPPLPQSSSEGEKAPLLKSDNRV